MSNFRAATRYAEAIIDVATELKCVDVVSKDFDLIGRLIRENREFMLFLKSPVVNKEKKQGLLTAVLTGTVCDVTMKFVRLLAAKDREGLLPEIEQEYHRIRDERLGIINVTARTAVSMTPEQERNLIRQLEASTKKNVRLKTIIDPEIRGGFIVQHEDTVWDASIRRQLELLRQQFLGETA